MGSTNVGIRNWTFEDAGTFVPKEGHISTRYVVPEGLDIPSPDKGECNIYSRCSKAASGLARLVLQKFLEDRCNAFGSNAFMLVKARRKRDFK